MVINLDPKLAAALQEQAQRQGIAAEALAVSILREKLRPTQLPEPRDEWERRLLALAIDCGVSLSDEALSRETMYD